MGQAQTSQRDLLVAEYEDKIYSKNMEIKHMKNKKNNEILELKQSLKTTGDMLHNIKTQHEILHDKFTQESITASDMAHKVQLHEDFWNTLKDEFKSLEFVEEYVKSHNLVYIEDSHEIDMLRKFLKYIVDKKNEKILRVDNN